MEGKYWWSHYSMDSPPPPPPPPPPTTTASASASSFWVTPLHLYPDAASAPGFDLNNLLDQSRESEELIPLFEKPLTPSDVGKLNRLVIPKQHAEKHFPLNANATTTADSLLGFEDEVGKSWRFRYSYWNSSQSYVLTKGWSRFVKDKRLHAGDIVIFSRHPHHTGRLFIASRRSSSMINTQPPTISNSNSNYQPHTTTHLNPPPGSGSSAASHDGNSKRQLLRLFGVNLECHTTDIHSASPHHQQYHHMDMCFSGAAADVYRQG